jgi:hypothetical protein
VRERLARFWRAFLYLRSYSMAHLALTVLASTCFCLSDTEKARPRPPPRLHLVRTRRRVAFNDKRSSLGGLSGLTGPRPRDSPSYNFSTISRNARRACQTPSFPSETGSVGRIVRERLKCTDTQSRGYRNSGERRRLMRLLERPPSRPEDLPEPLERTASRDSAIGRPRRINYRERESKREKQRTLNPPLLATGISLLLPRCGYSWYSLRDPRHHSSGLASSRNESLLVATRNDSYP